ncbi:hypothetical protein [Metabacillus fastidiosus]|uniref:XkdX family protein n=1 Tax=Metabacillus fastidiosus TaxID=1458 RepID=A0ABU6P0G5_9BACI|nr:hypothetical protein [Metabacillus fastidiosus]
MKNGWMITIGLLWMRKVGKRKYTYLQFIQIGKLTGDEDDFKAAKYQL